jgi:uncharacterized phosphatase
MITKKDFYFVRHGQTDGNIALIKQDHGDIPLNEVGRQQAIAIEPLMAALPIRSVCCSPLIRAKETKEIACSRLSSSHIELPELTECNTEIWLKMTALGKKAKETPQEPVRSFMDRVLQGINQALSHEGPVLIVAHGGVHYAACCFMDIEEHEWMIDNCIITHFSIKACGNWTAKKLNSSW